jgi:hypothetical protein
VQPVGAVTAVQARFVPELVVPEAPNPVGTAGTVEQVELEQVPVAVQGWPEPDPPLLVAGLCPCVHQLAT